MAHHAAKHGVLLALLDDLIPLVSAYGSVVDMLAVSAQDIDSGRLAALLGFLTEQLEGIAAQLCAVEGVQHG